MNSVSLKANAKINLFLDILGKRPDGYHEIYTVMQSVSLSDEIKIVKVASTTISITSNLSSIPLDESNIAHKAAKAFFAHTGISSGISIHLEKGIPAEAGLAGGSADGAAVIVGLNQLFGINLSFDEFLKIGADIGSDVPFCIIGGTAVAKGRGEILEILPPIQSFKMAIIKPDFSISTPWAYKQYAGRNIAPRVSDAVVQKVMDITTRSTFAYNVFEEICYEQYPQILDIKAECRMLGADMVMMSGSGSAFFISAQSDEILNQIVSVFAARGYFAEICHTTECGIEILSTE